MSTTKKYVFISDFDTFMCDLMELRDSKYHSQQLAQDYYVIIFYCPGNHRIYCEL